MSQAEADGKHELLTREYVYDKVWAMPFAQVAKMLGVSERALAQACTRYQLPRPRANYWTRLAVGNAPPRPALPLIDDTQMAMVTFGVRQPSPHSRVEPEPTQPEIVQQPIEEIEFQSKTIRELYQKIQEANIEWSVRKRLTSAFPAVEDAAEGLRARAKEGKPSFARRPDLLFPALKDPTKARLDIRVSRACIDRSVRVAQAIIVAAVDCGFRFRTERDQSAYRNECYFDFNGQTLKFGIAEICKRSAHTPTTEELAAAKTSAFSKPPAWDYNPTGLLRVTLYRSSSSTTIATFEERPRRMFDESVRPIIMALLKEVDRQIVAQTAERERQLAAMRAADERRKLEELQKEEQARVDALVQQVENWELARRIRRFVRAVEAARTTNGRVNDPEGNVAAWYAWAKGVADRIDPLRQ